MQRITPDFFFHVVPCHIAGRLTEQGKSGSPSLRKNRYQITAILNDGIGGFVIVPGITTKVTWECIHVGTLSQGRTELELCKGRGLFATAVSLRDVATKEALLSNISTAMSFPSYFGANWDALNDCLRDLSWLKPKGVLLVLEESHNVWQETSLSAMLIELWLSCAEVWARQEVPFHLAFTWANQF
jgi:RNAse (barnase) inhibitor barstar